MKKRPENLRFRGIIRTNIAVVMNGVKERKPPASERFYSFQAVGRGAARLKRREYFDRCGGRLKALP